MKNHAFIFCIIILSIGVFLSCHYNPLSFDGVDPVLNQIPNQFILNIPTYEGSNQAVHPDILFFENRIEDNAFILVMTPYPFGNARHENPSILVSEDGVHFTESRAGLNPLAGPPRYGYNDDPDIMFNQKEKIYYLYYLQTMQPDSQNVMLLTSEDAVHWDRRRVIHYDLSKHDDFIVSPSLVFLENKYHMFYVNLSVQGHPIQFFTSSNGIDWDKGDIHSVFYNLPEDLIPWHVDVIKSDAGYLMLCCGPYPDTDLYIAHSDDLIHWVFCTDPILSRSDNFFAKCRRIYRSTGIAQGDLLIVWFSFLRYDGRWGIGLKKYDLSQLIK